jgi:hypothetical protein
MTHDEGTRVSVRVPEFRALAPPKFPTRAPKAFWCILAVPSPTITCSETIRTELRDLPAILVIEFIFLVDRNKIKYFAELAVHRHI